MTMFIGWILAAIPAVPLVWVTSGAATAVVLTAALLATVGVLAASREPRRIEVAQGKLEYDLPRTASADSQLPNAA